MEREDNSHIIFDLNIRTDRDTGLPLLSEQYKIFELIRAYLHLPFRVAEYGCGKRVSIIIKQLYDLGLPLHALMRGMIIEADMSDEALSEKNLLKRPHALRAANPIYDFIDYGDEQLLAKFEQAGIEVDRQARVLRASKYALNYRPSVQFVFSRSHIFPIVRFWIADRKRVVERVIDPTLRPNGTLAVNEVRAKLKAPEAHIFSSTFSDRFRLRLQDLTRLQREKMNGWLDGRDFNELDLEDEQELVRYLNGASKGTIGDPATWTYANNIPGLYDKAVSTELDREHVKIQQAVTSSEMRQRIAEKTKELLIELEENAHPVQASSDVRDEFERLCAEGLELGNNRSLSIPEIITRDATWSERQLAPLTVLANIAAFHKVLKEIAARLDNEEIPSDWLVNEDYTSALLDVGIRLRDRIERLADVSRVKSGEIDARTLNEQFNKATISLIRQMKDAGMVVYFDQVGNVHGLLADEQISRQLQDIRVPFAKRAELLQETNRRALGFHSHIDTVANGGKYDGRLGVLSGVEIAHLIHDLKETSYEIAFNEKLKQCPILVSSYINEEMSFTGVSMPGSAAVAGLASAPDIYPMMNSDGEQFGEKLAALVAELKELKSMGMLSLSHDLPDDWEGLERLPDPRWFLPKNAIERHCEQADRLMKTRVPLAQAEAIMGIYQEDFYFEGEAAELAGLALNRAFRALQEGADVTEAYLQSRLTMGLWQQEAAPKNEKVEHGVRFTLTGESNHAGATALEDRFDTGVGLAKLQENFRLLVKELACDKGETIGAVIGDVELQPGKSRNVIPGEASMSLGITGDGASVAAWARIKPALVEALEAMVRNEDLIAFGEEEINEINVCPHIRCSVDLRAPETAFVSEFTADLAAILDKIGAEFGVKVSRTSDISGAPDQEKDPTRLDHSRRVSLLIDQSAGGSHNPFEAERRSVVAAGIIAQFSAWWTLSEEPDVLIYDVLQYIIPDAWQVSLGGFCSGALHDTCNVVEGIELRANTQDTISSPPVADFFDA
ncbi:MAG: hypothetical protein DHS20C08_23810 [Rhodomicrobium sp.]|nr:MAG: hypothetical protein DHS20C08_23810 [Rhodomicrobium sp.]